MREKMLMIICSMLLLTACSSNNEDIDAKDNESNNNTQETENIEEDDEVDEEEENEVFPKSEIVFSEFEEEPIFVEDLDEKNMLEIDDEKLSGLAVVYGDGELVSIKLNRAIRYDVETRNVIWENKSWGSPSRIFSLENGILHYSGFGIIKGDVTSGEVVEKIEYDNEEGVEGYISYNEPYRIGLLDDSIQVTNEETNKSVKLVEDDPEYHETVLMKNFSATELDHVVTTYDNETGEQLAEKEFPGDTFIYGREGTDELYVIYEPVKNQYGYTFLLVDGETLEEKVEYTVQDANGGIFVAHNHVFYSDPIENTLVALSGDLTEENYRIEIGGISHHEVFYADENYVYFVDRDPDDSNVENLIQFKAETGEVKQYIQFPHTLVRDFYVLDGKIYVQYDGTEAEYLYYIIDQEDVHRSMDE